MPDTATYLGFLGAIALLMITPGPDMMFVIANAGRWGARAGIAAAFGVAAGEAVHLIAAAAGLASLFAANPVMYEVIRYAGAAYLLFLGVQAFRNRSRPMSAGGGAAKAGLRDSFTRGMITNVLNPKMALFTLAFLPQFIVPQRGDVVTQALVLGVTFVAVQITVDVALGLTAGRVGERLWKRPRVSRAVNTVTGAVFLGLGARLAAFG